ncbi:Threonine/homoserine/homoserine lactone efflux protein [Maribacter orientalis]|uniref:Threonine/homoserine/homoserine lactone efflux protein n=1 Tax=Maribacter orientalis TaxID=228957 RepID=A0A1H7P987_9FLAO|nr:LysE family translocator [Maribacter orientalis]SEL32352.1 Threonine/homoserine/homoserine lactone efflux protein [Maribacter orientalis]
MNYEILLAFSIATFALALSPGPDNIFVLIQSITNGRKFGLAVVAGLMTGCLVHTTLLAFGVSAVIKNNPTIFTIIKIFGAIYLVYLAISVYRGGDSISIKTENKPVKSLGSLFRQGFIMNVLNPKVTIFFLAFFPGFLFSNGISTIIQFYVLGLLFIVISSIVFSGIAFLSGSISTFLIGNKKTGFVLKWVQIIVFLGIAIFLFFG